MRLGGYMHKNHFLSLVLLLAVLGLNTACEKKSWVDVLNELDNKDGIFSNRPQNETQYITMIRLKNPALVTSLTQQGHKKVIDADLAQAIKEEQDAFIQKLKEISPEIQVIQRYQKVLNAISIVAPKSAAEKIKTLSNVTLMESNQRFGRPLAEPDFSVGHLGLEKNNSVNFIGSDKAHALGFKGQNLKVGIIDTGIDYTHSMLGGTGSTDDYQGVNPDAPTPHFPNKKVVGGVDFVGTKYDSASLVFSNRIPKPDSNPMDEGGHGTHVGGTVAGIGDNVKSYSGVAPEAALYALKVFGADGSTGDEIVIAAFEYSIDPNGDNDFSDQLDVVNLSLGSEYGTPHLLYGEAVKNLSEAGTIVVASAGNAGYKDFIVGAPGTSEDAISVAASIDSMVHNWKFPAVKFESAETTFLAEAVEGSISKPISDSNVQGEIVFIGFANQELTDEVKMKLKGKVALIDRGLVTFAEKLKRAEAAGAIGAIVANNSDGAPFGMGGDGKVEIPAIMITKAHGTQIKELLAKQAVTIQFKTSDTIDKPEMIDTLTDFSSKGPRSIDALFKPEISAPGQSIVSAAFGEGTEPVKMSGTSMAAPHMAGVMALIKQAHPNLTAIEYKSIAMGTSKMISDAQKKLYPLSQQGAGRVQADIAVVAVLASETPSISLGHINLEASKTVQAKLSLKNVSNKALSLKGAWIGSKALAMEPMQIQLQPGEKQIAFVKFRINAQEISETHKEVDGLISLKQDHQEIFHIPVLGLVHKISNIKAGDFVVLASSSRDSENSVAQIHLKNDGKHAGEALLFNLLGKDMRKPQSPILSDMGQSCDLQAAGYRLQDNKLQFAIKLYDSITRWELCEISVLIDSNRDQNPEQEIAGSVMSKLDGLTGETFKSLLLDATKARQIRKDFEANVKPEKPGMSDNKVDFTPALLDIGEMKVHHNSSIALVEVDINQLVFRNDGKLAVKIMTTAAEERNVEMDDYLRTNQNWIEMDITKNALSYLDLPASVSLNAGESKSLEFRKGLENKSLMILMPQNRGIFESLGKDEQMLILNPKFQQ